MKTIRINGIRQLAILGLVLLLATSCNKSIDTSVTTPKSMITVTDIDGNIYHADSIGTQVWMLENLKTTKFNDGTSIPNVTDNASWSILYTPGFSWQNNDITNKATYGALYNWFAVSSGKLCPAGWHVATDAEWTTLVNYLGGETIAGGKLKEAGISNWKSPNSGGDNLSGFLALPGGYRDYNGVFGPSAGLGYSGYFWTSSENTINDAWYRSLDYADYGVIRLDLYKLNGLSVRCIKDQVQ